MSEENLELVRAAMESFNLEGVDAVAERIHPDFETTTPPSLSVEPDTYRGPEGVRRWFDAWGGTMDEVRFDVDELLDAGDRVVAVSRMVARSHTTGLEVEQPVTLVWTLRDRQAVRLDPYATRAEALRAVGLEG
jgi:ketosteroid isomerase-like protein